MSYQQEYLLGGLSPKNKKGELPTGAIHLSVLLEIIIQDPAES
jgi:hypothetical protein